MKKIFIIQIALLSIFFAMTLANEYFDVPHYVLGDAPTTPNQRYGEMLMESIVFVDILIVEYFIMLNLIKRIKMLEGLLPICANCHKIRNGNQWEQIEKYFKDYSTVEFTHSICPECVKKLYPELQSIEAHHKEKTV